jgi:hypothetical protein
MHYALQALPQSQFFTDIHNFDVTFRLQPFKCLVSAAAGALFNLNAHCWAMFSNVQKGCTFNGTALPCSSIKG